MVVKDGEKNSFSTTVMNNNFIFYYYGTGSLAIFIALTFSIYLLFSTNLSVESSIYFLSVIFIISINHLLTKKEKYFCYEIEILSEKQKVKFHLISPILIRKKITILIKDLNVEKDKISNNEFLINELRFYNNNKLFLRLISHQNYWNSNQLYHIYKTIENGNII